MSELTIQGGDARLIYGQDAKASLRTIEAGSVQVVCTSPPYYNLRDYGADGQLGLEASPEQYIESLVLLFREVRRVLSDDGTVWLNIGDSYAGTCKSGGGKQGEKWAAHGADTEGARGGKYVPPPSGLKPKDLMGIPWRVALALQADGWWLRNDIIWAKPNPMPSSAQDRCTVAHEYLFLLTKSARYYYDADAIREPLAEATLADKRLGAVHDEPRERYGGQASCPSSFAGANPLGANRRTVWTITPNYYQGAHFAVFPEQIPERCILAGSRPGDLALDPFSGSGTTGKMALKHGRRYLGLDINKDYLELAARRVDPYQSDTPSTGEDEGQMALFTGVDG